MNHSLLRSAVKWAVFFVIVFATGLSAATGMIGSGLSFFGLFEFLLSLTMKAASVALMGAACLALFDRIRLPGWAAALASLVITIAGSAVLSSLLVMLTNFVLQAMGMIVGTLVVIFILLTTSFTAFGSLLMMITALSSDISLEGKFFLISAFAERYRDKKGV